MLGRRVRDDAEAVRPGHEIPGSRVPVGAAPRVLLIDDRIPADDAFVHLLTRRGFAVTCAETGTRGLELAVAGPWAAVLLDLHLPDLPGLAVLSRLRAAGVHVPVIVITGWYGDGDHEAAAEALGAAAFLRWPVDIDEVVAELEAVRRPRATPAPGPDDLHGARGAPLSRTERVTLADLVDVLRPQIERALRRACPLADPDHVTDAAVDALLEARRHLDRFDPTRGVSFLPYVVLAARRNLLNLLAAERRRRTREDRYARGAAAAVGPAGEHEPGADAAALVASLRDTGVVRTDADAAVLRLWLDGERRTAVVATTLGLDDDSADAQRAVVKRVRDRIFQRLRRLGGALGRRARRPRPVHPLASRKKDHG